jgi:hypothetical protein
MHCPSVLRNSQADRTASPGAAASSTPTWLGCLLVVGLWLITRPYIGVRHDGILYLGQILRQVQPEPLSGDLFFAFGSQDSFSLFSRIAALLYGQLGLAPTQMLLLLGSHGALMLVTAALVRPFAQARDRWLALAAVAAIPHVYGGMGMLSFGEVFVTARTLAEPLGLAVLLALCHQRFWLAAVLALSAAIVHPLMAMVVLMVGWLWLCQRDRRWWSAAALLLIPLALAFHGSAPFNGLLQRFDAAWAAEVLQTNPIVYISQWSLVHVMIVAFDWAVLAGAMRFLPAPLSTACKLSLLAAALLTGVALLGADIFQNVLISGLQLWRGQWLTHVLALACLPAVVLQLVPLRPLGRPAALALALAAVAIYGQWEAGWAFALWAGLLLALQSRGGTLSAAMHRLVMAGTGLALAGLSAALLARTVGALIEAGAALDGPALMWAALGLPTLALPLSAGVLWGWQQGRWFACASVVAAGALAMTGLYNWDRRSPWTTYVESAKPGNHPFARHMPADAQVLWPRDLMATWALLGRRSYFSDAQGGGVVFHRATAIEFTRRRHAMAPLALQKEICAILGSVQEGPSSDDDCIPEPQLIEDLCRSDRGPDFLVLPYRLPRGVVDEWAFAPPNARRRALFLYDCQALR